MAFFKHNLVYTGLSDGAYVFFRMVLLHNLGFQIFMILIHMYYTPYTANMYGV